MITRDELFEWMGMERANHRTDGVEYVVDCPTKESAQMVADLIAKVCDAKREFCVDDGGDHYWRYLFLSKASGERVTNAYSSRCRSGCPIKTATCISPEEFFSKVHSKSTVYVAVDDLL